jgi:hypothetical protein
MNALAMMTANVSAAAASAVCANSVRRRAAAAGVSLLITR